MRRRRIPTIVGLLAISAGVLLLALPELGGGLLPRVAATLLTVGVGAAAVVLAARELFDSDDPELRLPTPESRPQYRVPGAAFAERLDRISTVGRRAADDADEWDGARERTPRERVYASLHELGVDVLGRTDGDTPGAAADRLAGGEWTADETAAAFFADGLCPPLPRRASLPLVRPELPMVERARHAVAELAERLSTDAPDSASRLAPVETMGDGAAQGEYWPTAELPRTRSTGRTRRVAVAVLLASAGGVVMGVPGAVLTAAFGIALAGAARIWEPTADIELTRTLEPRTPTPGATVEVTVTVRNVGETTIPDLRLLDGVPAGLSVRSGSPRLTTALRPGTERSFTYALTAVPGTHAFESPLVIAGDFAGARETVRTVAVTDGHDSLACGFERRSDDASSPREQATQMPGQQKAGVTGSGVEFDSLRAYRPGDPASRIDWHHRAKTGDLATVEFQEPRQPRVAVVVDARRAAYVAATPGNVPAPRHGASAAYSVADRLLDDGVPVGIGTVGAGDCWLPATTGEAHREAIRTRLAGDAAVPWTPPEESTQIREAVDDLTARLDPDVQVVVVSPLCDDDGVDLVRQLEGAGHGVSVVSPDCTDPSTVAGAYAHLARENRLSTLRGHDIPVRDWDPTTPLREVQARGAAV
ncbi:DUF58 domain-containing protein [Haloarcula argentinensis]|uniref:DUF58 domain-containing protein n=1 Tax=Haloarcula argentinensis TaxID=43776 RepID=A0ABU2F1S6_HALAR|nr:DUF58 domain-containing protein [Haloarcula argentinensis]EMA19702.1 hypothetical protein C443_15519 [Haloarcula argentinensis DSM 12282]MDS0254469.1 DUF58 domain-containing protein [Haloarcula argentinensis]